MTRNCSTSITPDSITGIIMAMEGIRGALVLLNGPMGCRFYHSTTSQFLRVRPLLYVPSEKSEKRIPVDYNYLNNWFFRQPRVPCTYLDGYDYVYGMRPKVREAIHFLKENIAFDLIAIVNSPGASLIGDNLKELAEAELPDTLCVMLETPRFSEDFDRGYETAILSLLQQIMLLSDERFAASAQSPAAAASVKSPASSAFTQRPISALHSTVTDCQVPPKDPLPTGFRQKKSQPLINILGLSIYDRYAAGDREELSRIFSQMGIGISCFLGSDCSLEDLAALPNADLNLLLVPERGRRTAEYLKEHFGMDYLILDRSPVGFDAAEEMIRAVADKLADKQIDNPDTQAVLERLRKFLAGHHMEQALKRRILDTDAELVFSHANTIAQLKAENKTFCGIEISLPGMGYTDIIPKTQIGIRGALFLIEEVLNGLMNNL